VYEVGPIWIIDKYSSMTVGWGAYDDINEMKEDWCNITGKSLEDLVW
jgi:hypothetical protein